jgi:predicted nucleic acid-binding protein
MTSYLLDTSFLSAFCNKDDANHKKAQEISKRIKDGYFIIPSVVVAELSSFYKNLDFRNLVVKTSLNIASEIASVTSENILIYVSFVQEFLYNLKAVDSMILFLSIENDARLLTFDKKLEKEFVEISKRI